MGGGAHTEIPISYYDVYSRSYLIAKVVYPHISAIIRLVLAQKFTVASWHQYYYAFLHKLFGLGFIDVFFMT